jgi:hypothetical protein
MAVSYRDASKGKEAQGPYDNEEVTQYCCAQGVFHAPH